MTIKTIDINWLGSCARCGSGDSKVKTEFGSEEFLFEGDEVACTDCGLTGVVSVSDDYADDAVASAAWDEFDEVDKKD